MIADTGLILTKNAILNKVNQLLESLVSEQYEIIKSITPSALPGAVATTPKISKGENYIELPWRMLDYPRIFSKEKICAIRTMFWWGNFFSVTLHLSGEYKKRFEKSVISSHPLLTEKKIYYCTNVDQWEHHFDKNNYTLISKWGKKDFEREVLGADFIKLAKKISLRKWNRMPDILLDCFKIFAGILKEAN